MAAEARHRRVPMAAEARRHRVAVEARRRYRGSAADGKRPPSRFDRSAAEGQCEIQSNLLKL